MTARPSISLLILFLAVSVPISGCVPGKSEVTRPYLVNGTPGDISVEFDSNSRRGRETVKVVLPPQGAFWHDNIRVPTAPPGDRPAARITAHPPSVDADAVFVSFSDAQSLFEVRNAGGALSVQPKAGAGAPK